MSFCLGSEMSIELLTSIASAGAAVATWLTVSEMKKQREAACRPHIIMPSSIIVCDRYPDQMVISDVHMFCWLKSNDAKEKMRTSKDFLEFEIPIYNIGQGAAKSVEVIWSLPIDEIVQKINKITKKVSITYEDGILKNTESPNSLLWKDEQRAAIDYILPASITDAPTLLRVPDAFIFLLSNLVLLASEQYEFDKPVLEVAFRYYDVNESIRTASFEILFELALTDKNCFIGKLLPKNKEKIGIIKFQNQA